MDTSKVQLDVWRHAKTYKTAILESRLRLGSQQSAVLPPPFANVGRYASEHELQSQLELVMMQQHAVTSATTLPASAGLLSTAS